MNNEVKTISPFRNFCITIGALPTSYLESMSYYEMLCWLCKYLENTVNPAINQNAEALKELQEYVANYFDNLDVQEEINNKLDDMAESGTLADIINVEMIGSLSDLTTTDKTDLVSAINEVKGNINNFNLTVYNTLSATTSAGHIEFNNLKIAKNTSGSLFKLYGSIEINELNNVTNPLKITLLNSGIATESPYTINCLGIYNFNIGSNIHSIPTECGVLIKNNEIEISLNFDENFDTVRIMLFPCLLFNTNFGD